MLNTKHKSLMGSTTVALQKKHIYCAHKHVINGAPLCSEMPPTLLSRQFWPGNISPGHRSSGPILKLRRCEGIPWLERGVIYCDIYCCWKTENNLSGFSCLVVQRATHQVMRCQSLAAPVYGGGCGVKLRDVVGWHLPMDLADISL